MMTFTEAMKMLREDVDAFEVDWQWNSARGKDYPDELPSAADWFEQFVAFAENRSDEDRSE